MSTLRKIKIKKIPQKNNPSLYFKELKNQETDPNVSQAKEIKTNK